MNFGRGLHSSESQTANERLQKALDERQMFSALIENSSDFIGIADPAGKPIYLNPAGRRMVGLSPDFPVEQVQIQDCYPPELAPIRYRCDPQDNDRTRTVAR